MLKQAFLRRLVVIRCDRQDAVGSELLYFFCETDHLRRVVPACAGQHRDVAARLFQGDRDDTQVFFQRIVGEARKQPQPEFHIRGDKGARWESIGRVIFNLQRGGIVKVGFISEPDPSQLRVTR